MTAELSDTDFSDDELVALLGKALSALPDSTVSSAEAPPAAVVEGALWIHEWLNMEAALAELTFDSHENVELAGVRSGGSLRELTFVSGEYTVEIEIEPGPRSVTVSGTVEPPHQGSVQIVIGGEVFLGTLADDGAFSIPGVAHGTILAFIETAEAKIRLGSFEV